MGMYDTVHVRVPLPGGLVPIDSFQTKDLENSLCDYTVTPQGRFVVEEWVFSPEEIQEAAENPALLLQSGEALTGTDPQTAHWKDLADWGIVQQPGQRRPFLADFFGLRSGRPRVRQSVHVPMTGSVLCYGMVRLPPVQQIASTVDSLTRAWESQGVDALPRPRRAPRGATNALNGAIGAGLAGPNAAVGNGGKGAPASGAKGARRSSRTRTQSDPATTFSVDLLIEFRQGWIIRMERTDTGDDGGGRGGIRGIGRRAAAPRAVSDTDGRPAPLQRPRVLDYPTPGSGGVTFNETTELLGQTIPILGQPHRIVDLGHLWAVLQPVAADGSLRDDVPALALRRNDLGDIAPFYTVL